MPFWYVTIFLFSPSLITENLTTVIILIFCLSVFTHLSLIPITSVFISLLFDSKSLKEFKPFYADVILEINSVFSILTITISIANSINNKFQFFYNFVRGTLLIPVCISLGLIILIILLQFCIGKKS